MKPVTPSGGCSGLMLGIGIGIGSFREGILNEDNRQDVLRRLRVETQRLDIGVRVHVEVQRRLRRPDFDLRAPIGDVRARHRTRIDVEDVTDFRGELPARNAGRCPAASGMRSVGIGISRNRLGMTSGIMPNMAYLAMINATRASGGMAG